MRDVDDTPSRADFCINGCKRWQADLFPFNTFEAYLESLNAGHYRQYRKTAKTFTEYGATISCIEGDWSADVDTVYNLYENVAVKSGTQMFDKGFFHMISKQSQYPLLCVWYQGIMIGCSVFVEEGPVYTRVVDRVGL